MLPSAQALVPILPRVEVVGEGKGLALPGQQRDTVTDRPQQHRRIAQPRQVQVPCEMLHELFDRDVITAPERNAVELHAQPRGRESGNQQLVAPQLLARRYGIEFVE